MTAFEVAGSYHMIFGPKAAKMKVAGLEAVGGVSALSPIAV